MGLHTLVVYFSKLDKFKNSLIYSKAAWDISPEKLWQLWGNVPEHPNIRKPYDKVSFENASLQKHKKRQGVGVEEYQNNPYGRRLLMKDDHLEKMISQPSEDDNHWRKMTFKGRQPLMKDDLWW